MPELYEHRGEATVGEGLPDMELFDLLLDLILLHFTFPVILVIPKEQLSLEDRMLLLSVLWLVHFKVDHT